MRPVCLCLLCFLFGLHTGCTWPAFSNRDSDETPAFEPTGEELGGPGTVEQVPVGQLIQTSDGFQGGASLLSPDLFEGLGSLPLVRLEGLPLEDNDALPLEDNDFLPIDADELLPLVLSKTNPSVTHNLVQASCRTITTSEGIPAVPSDGPLTVQREVLKACAVGLLGRSVDGTLEHRVRRSSTSVVVESTGRGLGDDFVSLALAETLTLELSSGLQRLQARRALLHTDGNGGAVLLLSTSNQRGRWFVHEGQRYHQLTANVVLAKKALAGALTAKLPLDLSTFETYRVRLRGLLFSAEPMVCKGPLYGTIAVENGSEQPIDRRHLAASSPECMLSPLADPALERALTLTGPALPSSAPAEPEQPTNPTVEPETPVVEPVTPDPPLQPPAEPRVVELPVDHPCDPPEVFRFHQCHYGDRPACLLRAGGCCEYARDSEDCMTCSRGIWLKEHHCNLNDVAACEVRGGLCCDRAHGTLECASCAEVVRVALALRCGG